MKTNEILTAITGINYKANQDEKRHAKKLFEIFELMRSFKQSDFTKVSIEQAVNFSFGSYSSEGNRWNKPEKKDGIIKTAAKRIKVETLTGCYIQDIPMAVYFEFIALFPSHLIESNEVRQIEHPDLSIEFNQVESDLIIKASLFCGKDDLRPAQKNVLIEIKKGFLKAVSTNGFRLFFESVKTDKSDLTILLDALTLKKAGKKELITLGLFKDDHNFKTGKINGNPFEICTEPFPNYLNVIPSYDRFIEVNRAKLINSISGLIPYANRTTKKIDLHINGSFDLYCEDLDFASYSKKSFPYELKNSPDLDISFHGLMLLECLKTSKDKVVRIYNEGKGNKAVILDSNILLMPVMGVNPN